MLLLTFLSLVAISADTQPVAGDYYEGDGLGVNWTLTLTEDHRFSFVWAGCLGEYGRATGRWSQVGGTLRLSPETMKDGADRLRLEYQVIRWGPRIYLVPEVDLPKFCAYVNQGWEPRDGEHGLFFMKTDTAGQPVTGAPLLPDAYREFLLTIPVRGRLISVSGRRGILESDSARKLRVGIVLTLQDDSRDHVSVVSVSDRSAVVEAPDGGKLTVGTIVSTLIHDPTLRQ
jgi:hypothetical protein